MYIDLVTVYSIPYLLIPVLLVVLFWIAVAHPHRIRRFLLFRIALGLVALSLLLLPALLLGISVLTMGHANAGRDFGFGPKPDPILEVGRLYFAAGAGAYLCVAVLLAVSSLRWGPGRDYNEQPDT